jgi:hypothetical protein
MPITYTIDREHGIVMSRSWGTLTIPELREYLFRLSIDRDFGPTFCELSDARELQDVDMTVDGLRSLAHISVFAPGRPRALVVPKEAQYGLARVFAAYSQMEGQQVAVFREWGDALQWLLCLTDVPAAALPR